MEIKIMIVVGARPNFMKASPILAAIRKHNEQASCLPSNGSAAKSHIKIRYVLVHTGQHYDEMMSDCFFADLNLPKPDVHLGVGSGSHAAQTAEIMRRFEEVLVREWPDALIVVGDVNSTLACALTAAKIPVHDSACKPLVAHVESGLRSFDRSMPEEHNRVLTDHLSDILFVTEQGGLENLLREGIPVERIHFVGNTMIDSLLVFKEKAETSVILDKLGLRGRSCAHGSATGITRYALMTLHRPSNVDNRETFLNILEGLEELSTSCRIIFSTHPRTQKRIAEFGLEHFFGSKHGDQGPSRLTSASAVKGIQLVNPLGYLDFLCLMKHAALVVTDSGGIQEETTCLGIPCVTVRENTERPVTVACGTNTVAGTGKENIRDAVKRQMQRQMNIPVPEKWDGMAGARILEAIGFLVQKRVASLGSLV